MESRVKSLIKNISILTVSNFASKILVFLMVPLYTSILTTEEYGTYDLIVSTVSLMYPILTLNVIDSVMLFLMDEKNESSKVISIGNRYIIISFLILFILLLTLSISGISPDVTKWNIYIFMYYVFFVLNQFLVQVAKGRNQVATLGIAGVLGTIVMIGANLLFLLVLKMGMSGFFTAAILSQFIPALYIFFRTKFWKYVKFSVRDKELTSAMLRYSIPLIFTTIGWWVNSGSDKYVVTFFYGLATNGLLSVAYKIPSILNTCQGIFVQAWQITAVKEYGDEGTAEFYGRTFHIMNFMMCCLASLLIILTKPLAQILYAKDFYEAWVFVPFLLVSSVLNCASGFLGPILGAKKDSKSMAFSAVYGAIVNLILNIAFVFCFGAQGVTIATVIASLIIFYVRKKAVGADISIYGYKFVVISWILLLFQSLVEIYTNWWVLEILTVFFIFILNRNDMKYLVDNGLKMIRKEV